MKILLIGNGFDLHHSFPTTYLNFINVTQYLVEHYNPSWKTVGDVLGQEKLHIIDKGIAKSYSVHQATYDITPLDKPLIEFLINEASTNMWFTYFKNSFIDELGWIDFEQEVSRVVKTFRNLFDQLNNTDIFDKDILYEVSDAYDKHILSSFDFFIKELTYNEPRHIINSPYFFVSPAGSLRMVNNKEEIINVLFTSLQNLSEMLKTYLRCFIDSPTENISFQGRTFSHAGISCLEDSFYAVISYNYTNTYSQLYPMTHHLAQIHGDLQHQIVLGINPDIYDTFESIDTSFTQFKKYHQRVFYKTDTTYFELIHTLERRRSENTSIELFVIGHSLDTSDADSLTEIIKLADKITIYYHNDSSHRSLINNTVALHEKKGFDELRYKKDLSYVQLEEIEWR